MPEANDADLRLRDAAAKETMERIRADAGKKLPPPVKDFLNYLTEHLFEAKLSVGRTLRKLGIRDRAFSTNFGDCLERSPKQYFIRRRLETADRLICRHQLRVGRAASLVGFDSVRRFRELYKAWCDEKPSRARVDPPPPQADYAVYRKGCRGELEPAKGRALGEWFLDLYGGRASEGAMPSMLDGPRLERAIAEKLWEEIRELPFGQQRAKVRWYRFRTTALFDLLRRKAREEGRKDRQMGIRVAKLALASVVGCGDASGERVHDLRAVGLAELANARRLAHDRMGSEEEFTRCWAEWHQPRKQTDPLALAEICFLHGTLRMFQQRYDDASRLLNDSVSLFESEGNGEGLIRALIQRASVHMYSGSPRASLADLENAAALAEEEEDTYSAFLAAGNLANAQVRLGKFESALKNARKAGKYLTALELPLGWYEIRHLEGNIHHATGDHLLAETCYEEARAGFIKAKDLRLVALVDLDLSILYLNQGKTDKALRQTAEAIPTLETAKIHSETIATVGVLAKSVSKEKITDVLLNEVRRALDEDPLFRLR